MRRVYLSVLSILLFTSLSQAEPGHEHHDGQQHHHGPKNMVTEIGVGFNASAFSQVNIKGGFGLSVPLRQSFFFSPYVGVFAGLSYETRKHDLTVSKSVAHLSIPVGLMFRYNQGPMKNHLGLGPVFDLPMGDFEDSGLINQKLKTGIGVAVALGSYFPVSPSFELGIIGDIKYLFTDHFDQASFKGSKMLVAMFGLGARFAY